MHLLINALEETAAKTGRGTIVLSTANHYADREKEGQTEQNLPPGEYVYA